MIVVQEEYPDDFIDEKVWRGGDAIRPYVLSLFLDFTLTVYLSLSLSSLFSFCIRYYNDLKLIVKNKIMFTALSGKNIVDSERLKFIHFPIKDCNITDDTRVMNLVMVLVRALSEGEVIYLHCWGGHGRTGTIVSIMLFLMYGIDAIEAMRRCQFVHDIRKCPVVVGSPQTTTQREQVQRVIAKFQNLILTTVVVQTGSDGGILSAPVSPIRCLTLQGLSSGEFENVNLSESEQGDLESTVVSNVSEVLRDMKAAAECIDAVNGDDIEIMKDDDIVKKDSSISPLENHNSEAAVTEAICSMYPTSPDKIDHCDPKQLFASPEPKDAVPTKVIQQQPFPISRLPNITNISRKSDTVQRSPEKAQPTIITVLSNEPSGVPIQPPSYTTISSAAGQGVRAHRKISVVKDNVSIQLQKPSVSKSVDVASAISSSGRAHRAYWPVSVSYNGPHKANALEFSSIVPQQRTNNHMILKKYIYLYVLL